MNKVERMMLGNVISILRSATNMLSNLLEMEEDKWTKEK
tara:strand:- start:462 stop:578 length:117 start_codon:yes stop_codon:yes gene_type:complete